VTDGPLRTCIGCREKAVATELLRIVAARASSGPAATPVLVVPDLLRRAPGRGAWLHREIRCAELALRRRAFGRALRVPEPTDPTPVLTLLAQQVD
jgi:predicted RNA-binding protein YlxR (DUF448 family)